MKIIIAVPSKGRISEPAVNMLEQAGLGLKDKTNRKLFSSTYNENIDVMFARAADIPEFVSEGIVDLGITGLDLIKENNAEVDILNDLEFGQTRLVIAAPEESEINKPEDLKNGMTIATEFPNLTKEYLKRKNLDMKIVKLTGSTEIAPFIGVADVISDLTSTGSTLKMNHLKIVDDILKSSIKLISNKKSLEEKKELIESISTSISGVLDAKQKKLVLMNVSKKDLDKVKDVIPAMSGPTISEVLSKDEETVAIQAVFNEDEVFDLTNSLRIAGAKDILVMPIERII